MKNIIYWTQRKIDDKFYVMALSPSKSGFCYCFTTNPETEEAYYVFDKETEAKQFITQTNKPVYYGIFGASYELEYVDSCSDVWRNTFDKWETTYKLIKKVSDYISTPWYKRVLKRLKGLFSF